MEEIHQICLVKNRISIVDQVNFDDIKDHLRQEDVINSEDEERISACTTRQEKMRQLLGLLPRRGPEAFNIFIEAVGEDYPWVKQGLLDSLAAETQENRLGHPMQCTDNPDPVSEFELNIGVFMQISRDAEVMKDWKSLGRLLRVPDNELITIEYANHGQLKEMVYQMLVKWQNLFASGATSKVLLDALRAGGYYNLTNILGRR